jgi:hypothetical protein
MKLTIAIVAVVLAASAAQAQQWTYTREQVLQYAPQAQHWTEAQWRKFDRDARCAYRNTTGLRKAGDPRAVRLARETQRRGGGMAAASSLQNTSDWQSLQRSHRRACRAQ